jgi:hypothetical protein
MVIMKKKYKVRISNKDKNFKEIIDSLPEDAWKNVSKKNFLNILKSYPEDKEITVFYYQSDSDFNNMPNLVYSVHPNE